MKLTKNAMIGISVLASALLIFLFYGKISKALFKTFGQNKALDEAKDGKEGDKNKLLEIGSKGVEVVTLQTWLVRDGAELSEFGPNEDGIDGLFGEVTKAALMQIKGKSEITLNQYEQEGIAAAETNVIADETETMARQYQHYN